MFSERIQATGYSPFSMNSKTLILVMITAIASTIPLISATHPNLIISSWLMNPVSVDGDVTDSKEWIDANSVELAIGTNYGRSPPFLDTKIWAKNDETYLYLLYRIEYPLSGYDLQDQAYIYYLIPDTPTGYIFSDASYVAQLGTTQDLFNYTGTTWQNDLTATPPGENNVEGMGHYDGIFYWFEIKKPLDSGDGVDWILQLGETYGYADSPIDTDEHLCVGLYDHSNSYHIQNFIQLKIANSPTQYITPVGGTLEPVDKTKLLIDIAAKTTVTLIATLAIILTARRYLK